MKILKMFGRASFFAFALSAVAEDTHGATIITTFTGTVGAVDLDNLQTFGPGLQAGESFTATFTTNDATSGAQIVSVPGSYSSVSGKGTSGPTSAIITIGSSSFSLSGNSYYWPSGLSQQGGLGGTGAIQASSTSVLPGLFPGPFGSGRSDGLATLGFDVTSGSSISSLYTTPATYALQSNNVIQANFGISNAYGVITGAGGGAAESIQFDPTQVTISVSGQTPQPPTTAQLAQMSANAYNYGKVDVGSYQYVGQYSFGDGFSATVYRDGDHYVEAIRGTEPNPDVGTKASVQGNLQADASIAQGNASGTFSQYMNDGATVVGIIRHDDPNAQITFTGHSLGGAVAEVLGAAGQTTAVGFDSPGVGLIASSYSNVLGNQILGTGAQISTYRLYGDQVSLVGTQLGSLYTVGTGFVNELATNVADMGLAGLIGSSFISHDPGTLASLLAQPNPDVESGIQGPAVSGEILSVIAGQLISATGDQGQAAIALVLDGLATAGHQLVIDPPSFTNLQFLLSSGSPPLESITLGSLDGLSYYQFSYFDDGQWSSPFSLTPGDTYDFLDGVTGFEFSGVGADGAPFVFPSTYLYGLTFTESGEFSANVLETPAGVPEPATWCVLLLGFFSVGAALRSHRQPKAEMARAHKALCYRL